MSCVMGFLPFAFCSSPLISLHSGLGRNKTKSCKIQKLAGSANPAVPLPAPDAQYWTLAHLPPSRSHDAKSSRPMIAVAVSGRNKAGGHPPRPAACRRMQEHVRDSPSSVQQQDDRNWPAFGVPPIRQALLHHHGRTISNQPPLATRTIQRNKACCPVHPPEPVPAKPSLVPTPNPTQPHITSRCRGRRPRDWRLLLFFPRRTA